MKPESAPWEMKLQEDMKLIKRAYRLVRNNSSFNLDFLYGVYDRVKEGVILTPKQRKGVENIIDGFSVEAYAPDRGFSDESFGPFDHY